MTDLETEGVTLKMPPWFYDGMARVFTLGREGEFRREFMDLANIQPGDRVLDVGCGTGTCAILAAYDVGKTGEVVGIDPSLSLLQYARKKAAREFLNNEDAGRLRFEAGLAENISEKDNSFDVVVSTFTLHHLPGDDLQRKALAEMKRVLKPSGKLLVVDFPGDSHGHHRGICGGSHELDTENDSVVGIIKEVDFAEVSAQQVRMMGAIAVLALKSSEEATRSSNDLQGAAASSEKEEIASQHTTMPCDDMHRMYEKDDGFRAAASGIFMSTDAPCPGETSVMTSYVLDAPVLPPLGIV
jgi:SAM-dependent methyltransferase